MSDAGTPDDEQSTPTDRHDGLAVARLSVTASVIVAVIVIVTNVINARVYGAKTLGFFALASSPWLLTLAISNFGENAALVRLLSVERARSERTLPLAAAALTISTTWTSAITGAVFGLAAVGLRAVDTDTDLVLAAGTLSLTFLLVTNPSWILQSSFVAFGRGTDIFVSRLIQPLVFLVLSLVLAGSNPTVWSLVIASVVSTVVGLAYIAVRSLAVLGGSIGREQMGEAKQSIRLLVSFAWRWAPGNLANALTSQAGLWAVASLGGAVEAGVYSRVLGLQERAGDLSARLQDGVVPDLVRHENDHRPDAFAAAWWAVLGPALAAATIAIPPAMLSSTAAMGVLGPEFVSGGPALMWVCLAVGFILLLAGLASPFIALDKPGTSSLISIGRAAVLLPVLIPLTSRFGAAGAAAAFAVVIGAECVVRLVVMADRLRLRQYLLGQGLAVNALVGAAISTSITAIGQAVMPDTILADLSVGGIGVILGALAWIAAGRWSGPAADDTTADDTAPDPSATSPEPPTPVRAAGADR